jgi:hypothetical protein
MNRKGSLKSLYTPLKEEIKAVCFICAYAEDSASLKYLLLIKEGFRIS